MPDNHVKESCCASAWPRSGSALALMCSVTGSPKAFRDLKIQRISHSETLRVSVAFELLMVGRPVCNTRGMRAKSGQSCCRSWIAFRTPSLTTLPSRSIVFLAGDPSSPRRCPLGPISSSGGFPRHVSGTNPRSLAPSGGHFTSRPANVNEAAILMPDRIDPGTKSGHFGVWPLAEWVRCARSKIAEGCLRCGDLTCSFIISSPGTGDGTF